MMGREGTQKPAHAGSGIAFKEPHKAFEAEKSWGNRPGSSARVTPFRGSTHPREDLSKPPGNLRLWTIDWPLDLTKLWGREAQLTTP